MTAHTINTTELTYAGWVQSKGELSAQLSADLVNSDRFEDLSQAGLLALSDSAYEQLRYWGF